MFLKTNYSIIATGYANITYMLLSLINLIFNFETILQFLNRSSYPPFFLWFKFNHLFLPYQMLQSALGLHFTDAFFPCKGLKSKKDSRKNMNCLFFDQAVRSTGLRLESTKTLALDLRPAATKLK